MAGTETPDLVCWCAPERCQAEVLIERREQLKPTSL